MPQLPSDGPQNPEIVFTPEYWGTSTSSFPLEDFSWIPRSETRNAKLLISQFALRAIVGSLRGVEVVSGAVFDPTDDQIAANSPHNFPGTLLLYDVESLRPLAKRAAKAIEPRTEEQDESYGSKLTVPPRSLMRAQMMKNTRTGTLMYGAGYSTYSNGEMEYTRMANIAYIAQARKGARQVLELLVGAVQPQGLADGLPDVNHRVEVIRSAMFHNGIIGETQVSYVNNDNEFRNAYRIKSLEIIAGGQPAAAPQKRLLFSARPSAAQ